MREENKLTREWEYRFERGRDERKSCGAALFHLAGEHHHIARNYQTFTLSLSICTLCPRCLYSSAALEGLLVNTREYIIPRVGVYLLFFFYKRNGLLCTHTALPYPNSPWFFACTYINDDPRWRIAGTYALCELSAGCGCIISARMKGGEIAQAYAEEGARQIAGVNHGEKQHAFTYSSPGARAHTQQFFESAIKTGRRAVKLLARRNFASVRIRNEEQSGVVVHAGRGKVGKLFGDFAAADRKAFSSALTLSRMGTGRDVIAATDSFNRGALFRASYPACCIIFAAGGESSGALLYFWLITQRLIFSLRVCMRATSD